MVFHLVNRPGTSIVIDTNWMMISGLGFFGVNVEESNFFAGTAISACFQPSASILP
jgi:hypothetical protein